MRNRIKRPFSPFVEFMQESVCVTASMCGGRTWPVAGWTVNLTNFGTATSKTKFVIGTSRSFLNFARMVELPSASFLGWNVTFRPAFSKAIIGGASWAAIGAGVAADGVPPKMSPRSPKSEAPAPAAGAEEIVCAGAGAPPTPPRRSRRSPPPPPPPPPPSDWAEVIGAAAGDGEELGPSRRSLRSRRSPPPPPPPPPTGADDRPAEG
mmetsp:Transcript_61379/g.129486  ORF Transcript_61379/g.129486 Transcript_61379/m.129486 type:complete len:208 (+) Transcript_61379:83-706(+)